MITVLKNGKALVDGKIQKRTIIILLLWSIVFFAFIGCNTNIIKTKISAETIDYQKDMIAQQADDQAQLLNKQTIDDNIFLLYYIGKINNCFVQNIMIPQFNDGNIEKMVFTETKATAHTISEGIAKGISETKTISKTESNENTLSWKFTQSHKVGLSGSAKINVGLVSAGIDISSTFSIASEKSKLSTHMNSEEISNSTIESVNNSFSQSIVDTVTHSIESAFNMSNYEIGYYYALGLFADIDVYQIVSYNYIEKELYATYFITNINSKNMGIKMISSKDLYFDDIKEEKQLKPIGKIDLEDIENDVDDKGEEEIENNSDFYGGNGTEKKPYLITNSNHFQKMGFYPNAYFKCLADIDMSNIEYEPISFSGFLDGNGYSINNIHLSKTLQADEVNVGLFIENTGTIKNLTITNSLFRALPKFSNKNINVYCGSIVSKNYGTISNCKILDSKVIANSSDIANKFSEQYNEDSRELILGDNNWSSWISQSFYLKTSNWNNNLQFQVFAGGIAAINMGDIIDCKFNGKVESNVYNMQVPIDLEQICFAGGIAAYNEGNVSGAVTLANVKAWIEMDNDSKGEGWTKQKSPKGICAACGLIANNVIGSTVDGQANGEQQINWRIYFPQRVANVGFPFVKIADYNSKSFGNSNKLVFETSKTYSSYNPSKYEVCHKG